MLWGVFLVKNQMAVMFLLVSVIIMISLIFPHALMKIECMSMFNENIDNLYVLLYEKALLVFNGITKMCEKSLKNFGNCYMNHESPYYCFLSFFYLMLISGALHWCWIRSCLPLWTSWWFFATKGILCCC